jgi:hypothetical protein
MRPFFVLFCLAACGTTPTTPDASTDAATEGGDQSCGCVCGMKTGPSSMTCAAICGAACPALPPKTNNQLILTSGVFEHSNFISVSNLIFFNAIADAGQRCATQKIGSCFAIDCTPGAGTLTGVAAGLVTISEMGSVLMQDAPGMNSVYPGAATNIREWEMGNSLTFGMVGDANGIPEFTKILTAPTPAKLTAPVPDVNNTMQLDRSTDLAITWQAIPGGVTLGLTQLPTNGTVLEARHLFCELDGMTGSAMIPKAALAILQPSSAATTDSFDFGGNTTADITPGGYKLHLHLTNAARTDLNIK